MRIKIFCHSCGGKGTVKEKKYPDGEENETHFAPIPKNFKAKLGEFVSAEGVIISVYRFSISPTETIVGVFIRENGASNIANVERDLEHLKGCKVRVKIEVLEIPKKEESSGKKEGDKP